MEKKMSTPNTTLCKALPSEFVAYLVYVKGLRFEDKPDYSYLKNLFLEVMQKQSIS
jgi:casein kinase I family protein HRR25